MMKWGGRKSSSASSSASAFAFSWLSMFKQMRINSEPNHGKMKQQQKEATKQKSASSVGSPKYSCGNGDGDALWKPSFGEDIDHEVKKSGGDTDESVIPRRDAKKHGTREGKLKFKEKKDSVLDDRKVSSLEKVDDYNREKEYELLRRRFERKAQSVLQEQLLKSEREAAEKAEFASSKVVEKDVLQFDSPRTICTPRTHYFASCADSKNPKIRTVVESYEKSGKQQPRKNLKEIEELKVKTKKKRQTHDHVSREIRRRKPKVRIYSPRMASKAETNCKVKALEDMRKSKLKMKRIFERDVAEEEAAQGSDSFAVIKCSLDPKQDFRDSMIEMIIENQIRHPEEMEELLACYLTLNADEYHDLIIKVFRQVWFDMNQGGLGILSNTMQCCCCE